MYTDLEEYDIYNNHLLTLSFESWNFISVTYLYIVLLSYRILYGPMILFFSNRDLKQWLLRWLLCSKRLYSVELSNCYNYQDTHQS